MCIFIHYQFVIKMFLVSESRENFFKVFSFMIINPFVDDVTQLSPFNEPIKSEIGDERDGKA